MFSKDAIMCAVFVLQWDGLGGGELILFVFPLLMLFSSLLLVINGFIFFYIMSSKAPKYNRKQKFIVCFHRLYVQESGNRLSFNALYIYWISLVMEFLFRIYLFFIHQHSQTPRKHPLSQTPIRVSVHKNSCPKGTTS